MKRVLILFISLLMSTFFYSSSGYSNSGRWTGLINVMGEANSISDSRISYRGSGMINVFLPSGYNALNKKYPLILALPGWAAKAEDWNTKAHIGYLANKLHYVIALVEMKTTNYETAYYPETNPAYKWGAIPGGLWVGGVIMPYLRKKFHIDDSGEKTAIIGLSTGARGAIFNSQLYPHYFRIACGMSGDYDRKALLEWIIKNKKNIMAHEPPSVYIYGDPRNNVSIRRRWFEVDNPSELKKIKILKKHGTSILLIHGKKDAACPYEMSVLFYNLLRRNRVDTELLIANDLGHNWDLWSKYLPYAFKFIQKRFQ